jgi:hypothetical protein
MQGLIIIRWSRAKSGHEVEAMKLADDATAHYATMAEAGQIAGHEWINNLTGTDGGMFIIRGDQQALGGVMMSPEFASIHLRGILHLEDWRWDMALSGTTVDDVYPGWRALVGA